MKLNIDNIRGLDANKTYYLANSNGEIKEADTWQKFKCFLGVGDGRAKAARLVEAVKRTLLEASDKIADSVLDANVRDLNRTRSRFFSVSGGALAQLAAGFTAANERDVAKTLAGRLARNRLEESVKSVGMLLRLDTAKLHDVMEVMKRAARPLVDNPPMKTDSAGRRTVDEEKFETELAKILDDAVQTVVDVAKTGPAGALVRFDAAVRDAMFATLYGPDGKRNDKDASAMGSIAQIRFDKVMANAANYRPNSVSQEEYAAHVRMLIDKCGEDPEMLDAIEFSSRRYLVTGDSRLRKPEEVAKRVENYRENMREMFAATAGDRSMLPAVRELAKAFSGLSLPKGTYKKIVEAAKETDLSAFKNLGADSDSVAIHNAVMELNKAVRSIIQKSGVANKLEGQDETQPLRRFIERAILMRLPKAELRGISAALSSPIAAKLAGLYIDCATDAIELPKNNLPAGVNQEVKAQFMMLYGYIDEFKDIAERSLGREKGVAIKLADAKKASADDFHPGDILDSIQKESRVFVEGKRTAFLRGAVKGRGPAADAIRKSIAGVIGLEPFDPSGELYGRLNVKTRMMMNCSIMGFAKKVMQGDIAGTIFARDLDRGMKVTLAGVGELSDKLETALDQIACFVTGKADSKFAALDETSKKKAAIVIGMLGQETDKAIIDGCGFVLDPKGDTTAISYAGRQDRDVKKYKLEFVRGQLNMSFETTEQRTSVLTLDDVIENPDGITIDAGFEYSISPEEMNRLTTLDLAAYDDTEALEEFNAAGEGNVHENRVEKMFEKIPGAYKIHAQCQSHYKVEVH